MTDPDTCTQGMKLAYLKGILDAISTIANKNQSNDDMVTVSNIVNLAYKKIFSKPLDKAEQN